MILLLKLVWHFALINFNYCCIQILRQWTKKTQRKTQAESYTRWC